jgi:membrane associated rhomboid family serine protease
MVGASGAIFGILMAFGLLFPNTELYLLFFPFPIKAKYFVTFYGLYELYAGLQNAQSDNVAHFAHLGGMLFAFILLKYWNSQRTNYY